MPEKDSEFLCLLKEAADVHGVYPVEAYAFVLHGLSRAVDAIYGKDGRQIARKDITGPQLCGHLHVLAIERWGMMAETVLRKWNVASTLDFGRIVFVLVEHEFLKTTDRDTLDEYRDVYNFANAFDQYTITAKR